MREASIREILSEGKRLAGKGRPWHFHLLLPGCFFNKSGRNAFVLEGGRSVLVHHSADRKLSVGKVLLKLLYPEGGKKGHSADKKVPAAVRRMVARAKQLNKAGVPWHNHVLFPRCVFNEARGKYALVFEDPLTRRTLRYLSKKNPAAAVGKIDEEYYKQKR